MRERTTWNRDDIAKAAASDRTAEDPRAMNQDHLQQQPAADEYVIGGPSEFAEDPHPSTQWKVEDEGGETARNEIGMPQMRPDTFNHPEKTAATEDEATLLKKADLCAKVARRMLPKDASEQLIEDQSLALMYLPNDELVATANRLAGVVTAEDDDDDDDDDDEGQQQGGQQQGGGQQGQGQQQGKQAAQQKQQQDQDDKQGQGQQKQQQDQGKEAAQQKQQQDQDDKEGQDQDDKQGQGQQQKQGYAFSADQQQMMAQLQQQAATAIQAGDQQALQAAIQGMVQAMLPGVHYPGKKSEQDQLQQQALDAQQQQQAQQDQMQAAIQSMVQQAMQQVMQGQGQQQGMPPMAQQQQSQTLSDDQLLDQMLQDDMGQQDQGMMMTADSDIQIEGASMDVGEVSLGADDQDLVNLFTANAEYQQAAQAHELTTGVPVAPVQSQGTSRTASTRTVGTRPTQGVSQLGGAAAGSPSGGGEVEKLSGLWQSAPDVKNVFG